MDITKFISERRSNALIVGDYGTYRKSLSRRILTLRRKLGRTTGKGRKFTQKAPITAQDIASNEEFIELQLLMAERAWAHAMYMKSIRSNDSDQAIRGATRTHILSRLEKARKSSNLLIHSLEQPESHATNRILLEAQAYLSMLSGALYFEGHKWTQCLEQYSSSYLVYTSLAKNAGKQNEIFQELLINTVEPSIRYAAYQQKLPRTLPLPQIVAKFTEKDAPIVKTLLKVDPKALEDDTQSKDGTGSDRTLPKTITWRSRQVPIEDAAISEALADVHEAAAKLVQVLSSSKLSSKEKAAAYDAVLVPSQDAVDAAKSAIDELKADGVPPADKRLQSLEVTRTALNYDLISWRIGRNRVLCGAQDGAMLDSATKKGKSQTTGSRMTKMREKLVLYDSILQSLESIHDLAGVAADQGLVKELARKTAYFSALRSIAIARSHALLGSDKNALALFAHAAKTVSSISSPAATQSNNGTLGLDVSQEQIESIKQHTQALMNRQHALVEIHNLQQEEIKLEQKRKQGQSPFIEHLDEYPTCGVDLTNLIDYPPKLRAIPVKPIFLDVAWNYIDYPGRTRQTQPQQAETSAVVQEEGLKPQKRGWFGFGR